MRVRIAVDFDVCEKHGQCVEAAPELFWFDEAGDLQHRGEADDDLAVTAEDAQFLCPTQAITITREE
jgi:ferredoxin